MVLQDIEWPWALKSGATNQKVFIFEVRRGSNLREQAASCVDL